MGPTLSGAIERGHSERPVLTRDPDRIGRHDDLVDEPTGVALSHIRIRRAKLGSDHRAETGNGFGRQFAPVPAHLLLDLLNFQVELAAASTVKGKLIDEVVIVRCRCARLYEADHLPDLAIDVGSLGAKRLRGREALVSLFRYDQAY